MKLDQGPGTRRDDLEREIKQVLSHARPRHTIEPSSALSRNIRAARFSSAMLILAVFVLGLSFAMPTTFWRWTFGTFSFVLVVVGAWGLDSANRALREGESKEVDGPGSNNGPGPRS